MALGLLGVAALGACLLGLRLARGPIDLTALLRREHARLAANGADVAAGRLTLAWNAVAWPPQPPAFEVADAVMSADAGRLLARVRHGRMALSLPALLDGRLAPTAVSVDGAELALTLAPGGGTGVRGAPRWLDRLGRVRVRDASLVLHGPPPAAELRVAQAALDATRLPDGGIVGSAQLAVASGGLGGTLQLEAVQRAGGTVLTARTSAISPASLVGLAAYVPVLGGLGAPGMPMLDAPVRLALQAELGPALGLVSARLDAEASAGVLRAGRGRVALAGMSATLSVRPAEWRLDSLRAAFAALPGAGHAPPPVITASAAASRRGGRLHATFGVAMAQAALGDLGRYWPEGTGGDSRAWLVENLLAGRAHDVRISGSLDGAADGSDLQLTGLAGGLEADEVALTWLRPVPGLEHVHARVALQGPDGLLVTLDRGGQNGLSLGAGSFIRITGLAGRHQFGDIDARLSGPLPAVLGLLNHPRLHLLSSGGLDVAGSAGDVAARLKLHIPLEARVSMDDITIGAAATLSRVHLGRIAAGRDLDDGALKLDVTGDGLAVAGHGAIAGIPAQVGLQMDFRTGGGSQVLQHLSADGTVDAAQLAAAGLPAGAVHVLTGGQAGLRVDYAARRDGTAALQIDTDLTAAALATPLGWSKPAGASAAAGGLVLLDHGRLASVDHLHAEGPGLLVASRAELAGGARTLLLDRLEIGGTQAAGQVAFPVAAGDPVRVDLSGRRLDVSAALDAPVDKTAGPADAAAADKPGQPWALRLAFDQVQLSHGRVLAPFGVDAASDGRRILHAEAHAGAAGELAASVVPQPGGRRLSVRAADAGLALRALGVADNLAGGHLRLDGVFDDTQAAAPLAGRATLTDFTVRTAPAIGRLLQAMTLYGLTDALRGPGLHFSRLVAPFRWQARVLHLANARAFSPSLGITAQGTLDLRQRMADVTGTVVPAYFFNQLLGDLPVIGRIFSPEQGGGVFAARYSVRGRLADPKVGVNPLAALTPGFLREGFGLLSAKAK